MRRISKRQALVKKGLEFRMTNHAPSSRPAGPQEDKSKLRLYLQKRRKFAKMRDKISEVGCVLFEFERIQAVQDIIMENSILCSKINRTNAASIWQLFADFSELRQRILQLQLLSSIARRQLEIGLVDETCFQSLQKILVIVKSKNKGFWKAVLKNEEEIDG